MIAGKAALRGELSQAYSLDWMRSAQAALGLPAGMWLPFTYPPTAAILFAPLSALPPTVGYLCFLPVALFVLWRFASGERAGETSAEAS